MLGISPSGLVCCDINHAVAEISRDSQEIVRDLRRAHREMVE